jgi:DNA-binding transcriptional LysR family regulator
MQLQLYQVRYFLALARTLNFTRAAEQCNVTQPALTKAVQKLEQELGGALIHRRTSPHPAHRAGQDDFAHAGENICRREA